MSFLTAIQADRLITQIREEADPTSPSAKKAFQKLGKLGNAAVPKILEALASADKRQTVEYVELLSSLTDDKTLPSIARGLMEDEPRIVSGTAWALSTNRRYNVNRLVDFLGEDDYSKPALIEVLAAHKDRLNVPPAAAAGLQPPTERESRAVQAHRRSHDRRDGPGPPLAHGR